MTGAMYAAISGMKTHMNKLNVIGNNVANVNTFGYKSARTTFKESIYTSMRNGSNGSNTTGGMNPAQIGYGCNIGTIDLDMSTKNYVPTGQNLDCMINGSGFFFAGPKPGANDAGTILDITDPSQLNLTRVGNFSFDSQGYLVDGEGSVIYGFVTTASAAGGTAPGAAAGTADKDNHQFNTQLVPIRLPMAAVGEGTDPTTAGYIAPGTALYPGVDANGNNLYPTTATTPASTGKTIIADSVRIDGATGKITAVNKATKEVMVVGYVAVASVANPNGVSHVQGPYYSAGDGAGACDVASLGDIAKGKTLTQAPPAAGGVAVPKPIFGAGTTSLITNGLESSGTDISTEFSEMISTQRGYQANTRIITVTDSMLEELVNIKR